MITIGNGIFFHSITKNCNRAHKKKNQYVKFVSVYETLTRFTLNFQVFKVPSLKFEVAT